MAFVLTLSSGRPAPGAPERVALSGTDLVVGSGADCDWRLDGVAARHCQFGFRGGQWLIVDLGGGTLLNGQPLQGPAAISTGDVVTIGRCAVTVAPAGAPAPAQSAGGPGAALLAAAGLTRDQVQASDPALIAAAGSVAMEWAARRQSWLRHL